MEFEGDALPQELLVAVLNRLSSRPLAVAACVSRSWKSAAIAVNSTPHFFSALSYIPDLEDALEEVLGAVLDAPFWPDFAIIFAGSNFKLSEISGLIKTRLPEKMPLIACNSAGIAGRNVYSGEQIEIIFDAEQSEQRGQHGLVLAVGRFPGVHVKSLKLHNALSAREVERFVVAASAVPHAGHVPDPKQHPNTLLQALEKAYGGKSIIVGGLATFVADIQGGCLLAHSAPSTPHEEETSRLEGGQIRRKSQRLADKEAANPFEIDTHCDFVSLVFCEERSSGSSSDCSTKRVRCQVAAAGGLKAVGPVYKVVSVRDTKDIVTEEVSTQISCERDGLPMDGMAVLEDIDTEINGIGLPPNHIGIFRKPKRPNQMPHFSLHELQETSEGYLFVSGSGVKTRDSFRFYQLDPVAARKSLHETLSSVTRHITGAMDTNDSHSSALSYNPSSAPSSTNEVIGGMLFGCAGRGHEFFGESNVESFIFQQKLPGISMAGMFCLAEFGPPAILPGTDDNDGELAKGKAIANYFSSMFLLFYT